MKELKDRIKSPVVIIQLISIITGLVIFFAPNITEQIQTITTAIVSIINVLAGLNNPTDRENF